MMTGNRNWPNFFLGLAIVAVSFLGLPAFGKTVIQVILGLLVAFFALAPRSQTKLSDEQEN